MSSGTSSDKVLLFSGKDEDWGIWSKKFRAKHDDSNEVWVLGLAARAPEEERNLAAAERDRICIVEGSLDKAKYNKAQRKIHSALVLSTIDSCFSIT